MNVRELPEWHALVSEQDPHKRYSRFQGLCAAITADHLEELQSMRDEGDDDERRWGYNILVELASSRDDRLPPVLQEEVIDALRRVGREEYGRTPKGSGAVSRLKKLGPGEVTAVLEAQDVAGLSEKARRNFVYDSHMTPGTQRIQEQLRTIRELGGEAGHLAERRLEALGEVDMSAMRTLAEEWQKTRDYEPLAALYYRYIVNQVGKLKISEIVRLVGKPDKRDGNTIWYVPNEWSSLYLEGDAREILRAHKLTG
jgi:phage FluMu protein gp41